MPKTDVVIKRRAGLLATVSVVGGAVAAVYAGVALTSDNGSAAVVAIVVSLVSLGHALAWSESGKPLLVADRSGVRVRLGPTSTLLPWDSVQQVEVADRTRFRDGHVVVLPVDGLDPVRGLSLRARLAARVNRQFYEHPLVAPFGLSTMTSVVDVAAALNRLAAGRAEVVVAGADLEPPATVEITGYVVPGKEALPAPEDGTTGWADEPEAWRATAAESAEPADEADAQIDRLKPAARLGAVPTTPVRALRRVLAARTATSPLAPRPLVTPVDAPAARREDVTIATGTRHPTLGDLALSPVEEPLAPELPEIDALRRPTAPERRRDPATNNVSLIIDATSDLSAQAMQRVRRVAEATQQATTDVPAEPDRLVPTVIGGQLYEARLRLDLSLDEVAERTRIRPTVLEAIEVDDFSPCGGDFYARGHLRMLAGVLELDPEPLLSTYDTTFASAPVNPRAVFEAELATARSGLLSGGERRSSWAALIATVLVLLLVWGVARLLSGDSNPSGSVNPPTTSAGGLGSPGPGNLPVGGPQIARVKVMVSGGDAHVVVRDRFRRTVFSGTMTDGESKRLHGEAPLKVRTNDGGVVSLRAHGHNLGTMGQVGVPSRTHISANADGTGATNAGR